MAVQLMEPPAQASRRRRPAAEPTIQQIITSDRAAPAPFRGGLLMSAATGLLSWASFHPVNASPLAWLTLVPILLLVRVPRRTRWMYAALYFGATASSLLALQWMRLGDPLMYPAWGALSFYVGLYIPTFVLLARLAVHRLGAPLVLAAPVIWVALEFIRAHVLTGFSWYYLGHTQYRWTTLIQISDLFGAYGVSFVVAMASAAVAGLVPGRWFAKLLLPHGETWSDPKPQSSLSRALPVLTSLAVLAVALTYGFVRRSQAEFTAGPRVALIQGNYTSSLKHNRDRWVEMLDMHQRLTGMAVQHQPDLVVWPETMFRWPLFEQPEPLDDETLISIAPERAKSQPEAWLARWDDPTVGQRLADMSGMSGAAMLIGIDTYEARKSGLRHYNSAVFVHPEMGVQGRYDKRHLVPFGEYVPYREAIPGLASFVPFSAQFGITPGSSSVVFRHGDWRFAPIICFEDTVPHLVRNVIRSSPKAPVDCLVNLTNDGWFHGSSELDQHLVTSAFRAVECRTPLVRAVNTGISAIVDGDGVIREPDVFIDGDNKGRESAVDPKTGRWHKQLNAALVTTVPLDNRSSLYVAWGDWFPASCCFLTLMVPAMVLARRRSTKGSAANDTE